MTKRTAVTFALITLIIAFVVAAHIKEQQITMFPSDHGNLAGNLHNSGLVFEMDGKVFFSNPADSNCLYSMDPNEANQKRLTSMGVKYINGANGLLYFYMDSTKKSDKLSGLSTVTNQYGIYRCKANGRNQTCLLRDFCGEVQLCGEYLYFQVNNGNGGTLEKIRVDQKNRSTVANEKISPVCYSNGTIYFTGVSQDHNIHTLQTTAGDAISTIIEGNYFYPVVQGDYIYYMNGDDNYSLWRANLASGNAQPVVSDRIDCFAMNDNYIYYAFSDPNAPSLRRCNLDGSDTVVLYDGIVNSINLSSKYVYFKVYGLDDVMYHMPLSGSSPASIFVSAY